MQKITEHQNMAKCDQDNFDNLVSDVKDCGQETSRKLQHLDGRNVNPEKMQELKAQLAQLQKQLYGSVFLSDHIYSLLRVPQSSETEAGGPLSQFL
jgi:hypothetical protein